MLQKHGYVGAFAAAILLVLGTLLVGVALAAETVGPQASDPPFVHVHPDGHWWRHDPATGTATDLGTRPFPPTVPLAGPSFSFGAAGDFGFSGDAQAVMGAMGSAGLAFAIALGDTTYSEATEVDWCNAFESEMGDGTVLLIAGNHDTGESSGGNINTLRQYCNFGIPATLSGDYGKEYYFDFPQAEPLARFILTACGVSMDVDGQGTWSCDAGDAHYGFVSDAIDGARDAGIPWVVVGMHKNCITNGAKGCAIGEAFQDLLLSKRVDLVLQAHDHNYQRSHQLTCADDDAFRPECLADSDDDHRHGDGEVINIAGTGGRGTYATGGTPDEPYYRTWSSSAKGFLKVDVSADSLVVNFQNVVGDYTDAYRIVRASPPSPDFTLSADPTSVSFVAGQSAPTTIQVQPMDGFTGTIDLAVSSSPAGVEGACTPSRLQDGGTSTCVLSGSTPGQYTVTITGTGGGLTHSASISVVVKAPAPGPDMTPPSITIASPPNGTTLDSARITIQGIAADDVGLEKVEWSLDGGPWTAASGTSAWSAVVDLVPGPHTVSVRATDTSGNQRVASLSLSIEPSPGPPTEPDPVEPMAPRLGLRLPILLAVAAGLAGLALTIAVLVRRRK